MTSRYLVRESEGGVSTSIFIVTVYQLFFFFVYQASSRSRSVFGGDREILILEKLLLPLCSLGKHFFVHYLPDTLKAASIPDTNQVLIS